MPNKKAKTNKGSRNKKITKSQQAEEVRGGATTSNKDDLSHAHVIDHGASPMARLKQKLSQLKKWQWALITALLLLVALPAGLYAMPNTRYSMLNLVGSADVTILVVDADTDQPLPGAQVELSSGESVKTDLDGRAFFNDSSYGDVTATITKDVYESSVNDITIANDDSQFGPYALQALGVPHEITVEDWLTGDAVIDYTITSIDGESVVMSDENGFAVLNVPTDVASEEMLTYTVASDNYNAKEFIADLDNSNGETIQLVQSGRHSFISNRDGNVGFYESNYDGTEPAQLIDTGEDETIYYTAIPNTDDVYAVMIPSEYRGSYDQLIIAKPKEQSFEVVDDAIGEDVRFDILAVDEGRVVYWVIYDDEERSDRYKLKTYEMATGNLTTVFESSVWFSAVYASDYNDVYIHEAKSVNGLGWGAFSRTFFKVNLEDETREILLPNTSVWSLRIPYEEPDKLLYRVDTSYRDQGTQPGYYLRDLADNSQLEFLGTEYPDFEEPEEVPDSEKGLSSPEGMNRVWIESRDGRGALILNNSANRIQGEAENLSAISVIRWINETQLTVKGSDGVETADYIVDIESGNYRKITNTYRSFFHGHHH